MHTWGDEDVDWEGINNAADYIGDNLVRWGRINVRQVKEKFGTVRVYCSLGFHCFHGLIFPRYCWIHKWWPYGLDLAISNVIAGIFNKVLVPYQQAIYRHYYSKAVQKWAHLREEILCCADYSEYLKGL